MSTTQKNILFNLIKSLTKSEKRQFKLYVNRLGGNTNAKFITLFNLMDKMTVYDESIILSKSSIAKNQLSNLKANLYKQILTSLRLNPQHQTYPVQIREQLDYATILYNKGLYQQSLKILEKAKSMALELEENYMTYEIIEFEKIIESQYITRSLNSRADDLAVEAKDISIQNVLASKLSNLSLQLYSFWLRNGYAKNEDDYLLARNYFYYHLPTFEQEDLGFREKLYLYMSQLWHSFIVQDFTGSYKYATKWVELFKEHPKMMETNPVYFLKGLNYLLESLYYLRYYSKYEEYYNYLCTFEGNDDILSNDNTRGLFFIYSRYARINLKFLNGNFIGGIELIPEIEKEFEAYRGRIDEHHFMVFYYKFACMHFGVDNYERCIYYMEKIIDHKELGLREDLLCYARVLKLISLYEIGADEVYSFTRSTYRFLIQMNDLHEVQREIISFIRGDFYPTELHSKFKMLHGKLKALEDHPYEKRSFLYLDIISWLESKIEVRPILAVIQDKARDLK
ncbi:hypothetical protein K6119_05745 [Paracrocinitomix mangrovi]|uniref:hypothetical protein n=1 Tax=Paracrocinitomix mangrovi TaxID=2862509 RepID=UPI001C8F01A3|nr:hypothetical protein [Paracrocinitomix mangrovi]UKN03017.1 hypothetical protein K6119_05745 [Paracrocinitomix mangrovi]